VEPGELTSFAQSVKLKRGETVVFGWIVFRSRAHRDGVNAKVISDLRLADRMEPKAMPFDTRPMIYGGFDVVVDLSGGRGLAGIVYGLPCRHRGSGDGRAASGARVDRHAGRDSRGTRGASMKPAGGPRRSAAVGRLPLQLLDGHACLGA
jgi:Protein of unknown function (DUF1428)